MIKHTMALVLTLTAVTLPVVSHAATPVSLDTDDSWTVSSPSGENVAFVPTTVPGVYNGGPSNTGASSGGAFWLYPGNSSSHAPNTIFTFTKLFSLPDVVNVSQGILKGTYWSDNGIVAVMLNGIRIAGPGSIVPGLGSAETFRSELGTTLNYSGIFQKDNILSFEVYNGATSGGINPAAFQADLFAAAVPEPGTWMLMLFGFGAIGFAMRSRAKTQVRFQFA